MRINRILLTLTLAFLALPHAATSTTACCSTTVIVVRHAEKVDDSRDPLLNAAGEQRAQALAAVLADAGLDVAYASQYRRTSLTAQPAADAAGIDVQVSPIEGEIPGWAERFADMLGTRHSGQTVLIVGHSNTAPPLVAELCDCTVAPLNDDDYDRLYIVRMSPDKQPSLIRTRYGAPSVVRHE